MQPTLSNAIFLAGIGQLGVLVATALVPLQLNWKSELACLPKLHQQMYWVYGGYIVLGIVSLGTICLVCHEELAQRQSARSGVLLLRAGVLGYPLVATGSV